MFNEVLGRNEGVSDTKNKKQKKDSRLFDNGIVDNWLTTKEAASFLGITPNALRIMVFREKVIAYKFGRALRFRYRDLRSLLERKEYA